MKDKASTNDEVKTEVGQADQPERKDYVVLSESGLFKNGKQYEQGDTVSLDEKTAQNFLELGAIE